jgi:hypothetical protein
MMARHTAFAAALAAAAAGLAYAGAPPGAIKHVVVLQMENHSFSNMRTCATPTPACVRTIGARLCVRAPRLLSRGLSGVPLF